MGLLDASGMQHFISQPKTRRLQQLKTQICFHRKRRHTRNHTHHMPKCLTFFYSYISEAVFYAGCSKYQKGLSQATWARGFNHFLNPQQHIQHDSKKTDFELQNVFSYCKMLQKSTFVQLWSIGHWLLGLMFFLMDFGTWRLKSPTLTRGPRNLTWKPEDLPKLTWEFANPLRGRWGT